MVGHMACLALMTWQISAREKDQQDANKKIKDGRKQHKNNSSGNICGIMNDLGLNRISGTSMLK